jgi:WD40 repeat protein
MTLGQVGGVQPGRTRLASGSADNTVRVWDVASGKETARLQGHGGAVNAVAFSPDGTRLASGSADNTVRVWDVASGKETARLAGHDFGVRSRLASGALDTTVRLWDVASGQATARLAGHGDSVLWVAFSPDGTRLASGAFDTTVRLWDVASGKATAGLEGDGSTVGSVAFSPDARASPRAAGISSAAVTPRCACGTWRAARRRRAWRAMVLTSGRWRLARTGRASPRAPLTTRCGFGGCSRRHRT